MNFDTRRKRMVAWPALIFMAAVSLALAPMSCRADDKTTILVIGDSLSSGYGLRRGETWVELLARDWRGRGMNVDIINDSISGDTTAGGVARLPSALRRARPDWVVIELGGNDGLRGGSLAAMQRNLLEMVRLTRQHGARPILLGMKLPPNYGAKYTADFEQVYQRVAASAEAPLLPFFIRGIEDDLRLFQADRIHPNAAGQAIIMENVRAFLAGLL